MYVRVEVTCLTNSILLYTYNIYIYISAAVYTIEITNVGVDELHFHYFIFKCLYNLNGTSLIQMF